MNRRELIAGVVAAVVVPPVTGQSSEQQQYAICKERGHTPTQWGNTHMGFTTGNFIAIPDGPSKAYPNVGEGEWSTCWHCKTRYRFVTTMEEEGK